MKALSGIDGAFLHLETAETPMHVASLHLFDLPRGYRRDFAVDVRAQVRERMHLAPVFTRKLAPMVLQFANPVWVEDDDVDLDHHVQQLTLPKPGTLAQLEDCAAGLHAQLLDRSRPLWRLTVINGLASGQVAYYFKVHHAVLDGQASVLLAQVLFDLTRKPRTVPQTARAPGEHPGAVELAAAALKHDAEQVIKLVRHLPDVVRTLAGLWRRDAPTGQAGGAPAQGLHFAPRTRLNVPITAERGFAAMSVPLDKLKRLATAHGATLNDIVLALCAGTMRRYLAHRGGVPKAPLMAAMPISLREAGNAEYTTKATMSLVSLATHIADPIDRLHAIRDASTSVKSTARRARSLIPTDFPTIGLPWLLQAFAALYGRGGLAGAMPPIANLVVSNVPGPRQPLYVAGARMATYWPLSIPEHGLGVNLTVMSYAGAMGFGFITARAAVPDARKLTAALQQALDELVERSASEPHARRGAVRR